jgi:6-phosphogluconolactonase
MKFLEYPDRATLHRAVAASIGRDLTAVIAAHGAASLSVPGGTSPGPVFDLLAEMPLPWAKVSVLLNDERWVDETSVRSNTRLLRERLLRGAAAEARLLPLYAPATTPEERLADLARGIAPHLPLSVLLLGMGADMHTASLFPGADRLAEALAPDAPVLLPMRSDAAGEPRITLTAPVLQAARHIHLLITGAEKRAALARAMDLSPLEAPVRIVLDQAIVHWAE